MGIFRRNQIDLSDEGLALTAEESNEMPEQAAADQNGLSAEADMDGLQQERDMEAEEGQEETSPVELSPGEKAEREAAWRQAVEKTAAQWPQAAGQGKELILKMNEIGSRYGDPLLWQKAPESIMQEAAIELFGMPVAKDNDYAGAAARAARAAVLREQDRRAAAKLGLAKARSIRRPAAPPSEEERIVAEIAGAKRRGIF